MSAVAPLRGPVRAPAGAGGDRRRRLEVVGTSRAGARARSVRRARAVAASVLLVVALSLLGLVAWQVSLAQGQFDLEELRSRAAAEQDRYERLRLRAAELESPSRVVSVARERLGMVPPARVTYLSPPAHAPAPAPPTRGPDTAAAGEHWSSVKRQLARR